MAMTERVLLEDSAGLPVSTVTGMLKELVSAADTAAKLAGGAEEVLLFNDDTEASATNSRVAGIKNWLHTFRRAMYELDEALDIHNRCVARQKQQQPGEETRKSIRHWFRSSSTSVHDTECKRLKKIVENLDKKMDGIKQHGHQLSLEPISSSRMRWSPEFSGETPCYDMVGDIEHQKLSLIGMLTDKQSASAMESDQCTSYSVVIVGRGGTGKTTLARKAFTVQEMLSVPFYGYVAIKISPLRHCCLPLQVPLASRMEKQRVGINLRKSWPQSLKGRESCWLLMAYGATKFMKIILRLASLFCTEVEF